MFEFLKKLKEKKQEKEKITRSKKLQEAKEHYTVKKKITGDFDELIESFRDKSLIMLIIGKRGGGKTALGMSFVELGKIFNKKIYAVGFEDSKVPSWVKKSGNVEEVPNSSLVLIDEAGIAYSSRSSMKKSNKELSNLLSIARHKNLSLIFVTQNSAMLDLNVLRLADVLLFKEPSLLQLRFERKALQDMFSKVSKNFKTLKDKRTYFYVISDEFEGLVVNRLPGFWNESISKSFSKK